ncbi:MAG: hypothetical protein JRJ46_10520, partial [Deltaproteobacteria bacterium]|nr:hypothetical protein [Deltaproteobacteria bacterium]
EDAKINTLQTNLSGIRSAVETYYALHGHTYPGRNKTDSAGTTTTDEMAETAFKHQLTQYTNVNGLVQESKDSTYPFGPYIKGGGLPNNPFTNTNTLVCDYDEDKITIRNRTTTGSYAWKFFPITGVFIANDTTEHSEM